MFIAIEGLDGAGKTTLLKGLQRTLEDAGYGPQIVREPGGTPAGEQVRNILKNPDYSGQIPSMAEALLFYASRVMLAETVTKPALATGAIVIYDRFELSTFAYQGYGLGLLAEVAKISEISLQGFQPDLYLFIDVPPEISLARRLAESGTPDSIEARSIEFFERCRAGFKAAAAFIRSPIVELDGTKAREDVLQDAINAIVPFLREKEDERSQSTRTPDAGHQSPLCG